MDVVSRAGDFSKTIGVDGALHEKEIHVIEQPLHPTFEDAITVECARGYSSVDENDRKFPCVDLADDTRPQLGFHQQEDSWTDRFQASTDTTL